MTVLYVLCELSGDGHLRHAVKHPQTGRLVSNRLLDEGYMLAPEVMPQDLAEIAAAELSAVTGERWQLERAPSPCPVCGREAAANDFDFCYPTTRARTAFRAGCNEHDGGCGHEEQGASYDDVVRRWNRQEA